MAEKVLVIDDDPDVSCLTTETLQMHGYDISIAYDGKNGLEKAKTDKPDLIILDVMMPGELNGYDVCEKLKNDPSTKNIPVIIFTARDTEEDIDMALSKNADWYIAKPFDANTLIKHVKRLLKLKKIS